MNTIKNNLPRLPGNLFVRAGLIYVIITAFCFLVISALSSCKKEAFDFDKYAGKKEGAQWGIPLVHGTLGILDIINDTTHLNIGDENLIHLVYSSEMSTPALGNFIQIPDIAVTDTYSFSLPEFIPLDDSVFIPYSQMLTINPGEGVTIDSLYLSSCLMHLQINTNLNRDARIRIIIPSATENGQSYSTAIDYQWSQLQSQPIQMDVDMQDYILKLKNAGGISDGLEVLFEVLVFNNSMPDNSPYTLEVQQQIGDVSLEKCAGKLGDLTIPFESTSIPLDIFKNQLSGNVNFSEPKISFRGENSIGANVQLDIVSVKSYFAGHPEMNTALTGNFEEDPWMIASPVNGNHLQSTSSLFEINKDNSNLRDVLYDLPDRISFVARANVNPDEPGSTNFFFNESGLAMTMDIELPLYGMADQLVLQDHFKFNFDDLENLKSAEFKLNLENNFSLQAGLQVYFADDENLIIDSLFSTPLLIGAGETDATTMKVTRPSQATVSAIFGEDRLSKIKHETQNIIIRSTLDTPDNIAVKIFTDNYLDVHIGALYTRY